jgi:hypothetical protein
MTNEWGVLGILFQNIKTLLSNFELPCHVCFRICALLNGKGAAKGPKFQAKVANLANRTKAEELIKQHIAGTRSGC